MTGSAIDFDMPGVEHADMADWLRWTFSDKYGIGLYDWGVHLDVRPDRADWDERTT